MPPRAPGPHPCMESGPSAADPARVRDPPQSASATSLPAGRRPAGSATRPGQSRPAPRPKTDSPRWPDQRISPGRMTWTKFSARTVPWRGGDKVLDDVVVPLKAVEHPRDGIWGLVLAVADYRTRDNRLRASSGALD